MLIHWIWFAECKLRTILKRRFLEHFRDPEDIYYSDIVNEIASKWFHLDPDLESITK